MTAVQTGNVTHFNVSFPVYAPNEIEITDYSGEVFSAFYLLLGLVDMSIMLVVLRKLTKY